MLEQVLLNLAANARDAMPGGGQLSISTAACLLTGDDVAQRPDAQPGPHIRLSVADTGTGIPPELVARIFEPFFTTKDIGKGTGLGLATVYGIIKQHRGWITVDSQIGAGTTFHVFLPATTKPAPPAAPPPDPGTPTRGGLETILVVEDEPALRSLVRGILEHSGYTVLEAASGKAALEVWEQHRDRIDLLLTDMIMPDGVNGRELAVKLQATLPTLRILYTSGYSPDVVGADFVLEEGVNFLAKPYSPRQLAETVRNCLDRTSVG
jgi:CheY-like chemotaxis protein